MFINRSRNKSGTTSIRVLQKRGRNNVLVKSFGSSRDKSEIDRLVEQAREFIERAFRMNKTDLRNRPMYHRLKNRIERHVCICFCAYVLQLEMKRLLKAAKSTITVEEAREL